MGEWRYGVWCWSLKWRRNLFDWEQKDVDDLMRCLAEVNLVQDSIDGWLWVHDKDNMVFESEFRVRKLKKWISRQLHGL
ncbi:unnamed protein product [Lupinus luteus]|uniref:Uncharacterized protein n=1 Tax=Lupinus luteus TaxID=3873 RepID=A0AAV1YHD4_LUPLU